MIRPAIEAVINLKCLKNNLQKIRKAVGPKVHIMAIVKASAYGHGMTTISEYLFTQGVNYFGVARLEEALQLRKALNSVHILILSPIPPENFSIAVSNQITLTLTNPLELKQLSLVAHNLNTSAKIHIKIDTGLHRTGIESDNVVPLFKLANSLQSIKVEGIFTHFANGDDRKYTKFQLKNFNQVISQLGSLTPPLIHACASKAIFSSPEAHFNLVRPGLSLYENILDLSTHISRIHDLKPGDKVGYDTTFTAKRKMHVATIMMGYADGLRRAPLSWPYVLINNGIAPIIGRISMDQAVVDITHISPPPTKKSKVHIISSQALSTINESVLAEKIGTSTYELLTSFSPDRITRTYIS